MKKIATLLLFLVSVAAWAAVAQEPAQMRVLSKDEAATFEILLKQQERIGTYVPIGLAALSAILAAFLGYMAWRFGRDFKDTLAEVRKESKEQRAEVSEALAAFKADIAAEALRVIHGHDESMAKAVTAAKQTIKDVIGLKDTMAGEKDGLDKLVIDVRQLRADDLPPFFGPPVI